MTVFTRIWDVAYEALPPDTENAKNGAERINETKVDARERLEVDHSMAGDTDDGAHKKITLVDPLGAKPVQVNDETYIYSKDVAGTAELFFEDEAGNEIQLSSGGELGVAGQAIVGILTGDVTGDVTGNADTATALETARTLNGTAFDGTANVNINARITGIDNADTTQFPLMALNNVGASNQATYTDTNLTWNGTTNALTCPSFIGALTGNVTGNVTGDITGNADTADAWSTGRTITLTGDITGVSGAWTGSGNISFATTLAANSVNTNEIVAGAVQAETATSSAGAVGTYALLHYNGVDTTAGTNRTGGLSYVTCLGDLGAAVTGTWKCMGHMLAGTAARRSTLWLRVS